MQFRNYYDVYRPRWSGVLGRQNALGFLNNVHRSPSTENFIAIEVVACRRVPTVQRELSNRVCTILRSETTSAYRSSRDVVRRSRNDGW